MMELITAEELEAFRKMQRLYLRRGRRAFSEEEFAAYRRAMGRVREFIRMLDSEAADEEADVVYWYYYKSYTAEAVGMHIFFSERKVRRIRRRVLDALRRARTR